MASATRAVAEQHVRSALLRLTAQVSQRNKVSAYLDRIFKWKKREFDANREPIQAAGFRDPGQANYHTFQAKWTSTISSRALLEVGYSQVYERLLISNQPVEALREVFPENIPVPDLRPPVPSNLRTCIVTPCYWDAGYDQTGPWFANTVIRNDDTGIQTNNYWGDIWITPSDRRYPNAALSYVTGSHNFKVGMQWSFGDDGDTRTRPGHINLRVRGGLPQPCDADPTMPCEDRHFITANNYPTSWNTTVRADRGIYVQDTWTLDRLTINAGLRWDYFESVINTFRTGDLPAGRFIGARGAPELAAPPHWNDIAPRFSVVYDLFGDARTALKFSMNKFMRPYASGHAERYSPYREVGDNRDWFDCVLKPSIHTEGAIGNPRGDCATAEDLGGLPAPPEYYLGMNHDGIAQDHEIGLRNNTTVFAETPGFAPVSSRADPNLQREYNWETHMGIQHEILPRVSLNVGYFRRVFYDIEQRSNEALIACDRNTARPGVPCGSWLPFMVAFDDPNGRWARLQELGQTIDIDTSPFLAFDLLPEYRGLVDLLDVTSDINRNYYNGFEVSTNVRLPNGGTIFGGWTAHQHIQDTCGLTVNPNGVGVEDPIRGSDEGVLRGGRFCQQSELGIPFRHDFKLFGAYPLPYDFEFSGSIQAYSGGERELRWGIPSSYFPGGVRTSGATVQVFAPGSNYYDYWTQVDIALRRIFRFGNYETSVQADIYNLMNSAVVVDENDSYGSAWGRPTRLLQGRLLRLAFQVKW